jgi:glycosyltransferase involved in cell wall biosynthesis
MQRLSICVPTYNRAPMLGVALETIRSQSYDDFELVVVDNNSTDETEDLVRSIQDPRLRYVRNPENVGLIHNQNRCIEEASGEIVAIYHDHDFYHPDLVKRSMELLAEHPAVGVVCSAVHLVDMDDPDHVLATLIEPWGRVNSGRKMRRQLLREWSCRIMAPTAMARKACFERVGGFIPEFGGGCDRELWLRIFRFWDFGYLNEPLARLRERPRLQRKMSSAQAAEHWFSQEGHAAIQKHHLEQEYAGSRVRLFLEDRRLTLAKIDNCWKTALWAVANDEWEVSKRAGGVFRELNMPVSEALWNWLERSGLAQSCVQRGVVAYRAIHPKAHSGRP